MKKQGNTIITEAEGLRRKADGLLVGNRLTLGYTSFLRGKWLDEPRMEEAEDYEDVIFVDGIDIPNVDGYNNIVAELIHKRYSLNDEMAILRQRDTKKEEFEAYDAFCEECKEKARNYINNKND